MDWDLRQENGDGEGQGKFSWVFVAIAVLGVLAIVASFLVFSGRAKWPL
jgi:hypothetical protein